MAKIKVTSPKVEEYVLVVSIPLKKPILILGAQTVGEAEDLFIYARNMENDHHRKVEYDRARALLKWAGCCNAKLKEIDCEDRKLFFTFAFSTIADMNEFYNNMVTNVSGATMK